ncbi:hypothetical protein SHANETTE_8 [Bacillus phage Shanette]|uniref:Uncharacterized protein n=1 Tax=Bacillus phage Shanette TaxID=1296656 RepID=S5MTJ4_9CAUD|nr:hypothetical protein AVV46_gp008 [Bacillus phage Shanette]AGR47117.1 hypothetical protein SHANETTE_8 [Bacillus phage Shanette]
MPLNVEYLRNGHKGNKTYQSMTRMRQFIKDMELTDYALATLKGNNLYDKSAYKVIQRGNDYKHSSEY